PSTFASIALLAFAGMAQTPKPAITPEQAEFFETKVRPVLFASCFTCHGSEQQMGNLRLDSDAAIKKGNAHGPALVPGDPEKSLLVQAIRYTGKIKMPPNGKLKQAEIDALTQWIQLGAPWPGTSPTKTGAGKDYIITVEQRRFWS